MRSWGYLSSLQGNSTLQEYHTATVPLWSDALSGTVRHFWKIHFGGANIALCGVFMNLYAKSLAHGEMPLVMPKVNAPSVSYWFVSDRLVTFQNGNVVVYSIGDILIYVGLIAMSIMAMVALWRWFKCKHQVPI